MGTPNKLYATQVRWGREVFATGELRQARIAEALQVTETTVRYFLIGLTYRDVGGPIVIPRYVKK